MTHRVCAGRDQCEPWSDASVLLDWYCRQVNVEMRLLASSQDLQVPVHRPQEVAEGGHQSCDLIRSRGGFLLPSTRKDHVGARDPDHGILARDERVQLVGGQCAPFDRKFERGFRGLLARREHQGHDEVFQTQAVGAKRDVAADAHDAYADAPGDQLLQSNAERRNESVRRQLVRRARRRFAGRR
jgi:hypothetical protein